LLDKVRGRLDVLCGNGVLQCFLGQAVSQAPAGGTVPQHRDQATIQAFQFRHQHVTEQVVVAVPLSPPIQRHQEQVRPGQIGQRRASPFQVEYRLAQRSAHPLQHRGPGQERPLPLRDARQELLFHVLADQPVVPAERHRGPPDRASFPQVERRQVEPGRPALRPPVQFRHVGIADRDTRVAQQRCRLFPGQ